MVAAFVSAGALACHSVPGLGSVAFVRRGTEHTVDLSTCRERLAGAIARPPPLISPNGVWSADVRASGSGKSAKQTIWITNRRTGRSRPVFSETQWYRTIGPGDTPGPILLLGISGDGRWIFFAVDPGGSASIAADGLTLRVASTRTQDVHRLVRMLPYRDYVAWCGGRLVFTAGTWRVATDEKHLLAAAPPAWHAHRLVTLRSRSWGSLACAPDGRSLVAQSQRQSSEPNFFATHWALWRVGLDGSSRRLTAPPPHHADESPRFAPDGSLLFVRSRHGFGKLYALHRGRLLGPLLSLGYSIGYYGHQDWWSR